MVAAGPGSLRAGEPRLTCDQLLRRLDDYLDRALSPAELDRVEHHLADCLACAKAARFEAGLIAGIRIRLRRVALPESLSAAIHTSLATEPTQHGGGTGLPPGGP
jgi:anti-sigma factor RsiW